MKRTKYKKKHRPVVKNPREKMYKDTMKSIKVANSKLKSLGRKGRINTFASKVLIDKLKTVPKNGLIKILRKKNKNYYISIKPTISNSDLRMLNKYVTSFINSLTSTKKGINKVKNKTLKSLKGTLKSIDNFKDMSDSDAEFFYNMLDNSDFDYLSSKIDASTLFILIDEAIEENDFEDDWLNRLNWYIDFGNDEDLRKAAIGVYEKYIV